MPTVVDVVYMIARALDVAPTDVSEGLESVDVEGRDMISIELGSDRFIVTVVAAPEVAE